MLCFLRAILTAESSLLVLKRMAFCRITRLVSCLKEENSAKIRHNSSHSQFFMTYDDHKSKCNSNLFFSRAISCSILKSAVHCFLSSVTFLSYTFFLLENSAGVMRLKLLWLTELYWQNMKMPGNYNNTIMMWNTLKFRTVLQALLRGSWDRIFIRLKSKPHLPMQEESELEW